MMGSNLEPIPITSQKHDPAWKHCQMFRNGDRVQLKCVYCNKMFKGGGIHRIKEHLAGHKGNAATCLRVPPDVRLSMQQSLDGVVLKKSKKQRTLDEMINLQPLASEIEAFGKDQIDVNTGMELLQVQDAFEPLSSSLLVSQEEGISSKGGERRKSGRGKISVANANANANAVVVMEGSVPFGVKKVNDGVHMAIGRFLYDIGAPLDAVNSVYFQPMVEAIASAGPEVVKPSYHDLRGWVLQNSVEEVKNDVDKVKATWVRTGCSVLVDQHNTMMGRTLLNIFVYCPEGVVFVKSIDATDVVTSSNGLYELLKQAVEDIGVIHVLQVITSMEEQYIVAGRRLAETFPTLYWAPCAAHCIDSILESFTKLEWINAVIEKAKYITRFVYNDCVVLNMMRRYTFGTDIVERGNASSSTNFATLKCLVDHKRHLEALVTSQEWMDCPYSKKPGGLEMLEVVSSQSFWSSCVLIVHLTKPLLQLLTIACSKKRPAMGYVYAGMYRAIEAIKKELVKREDYKVYWDIIDAWWKHLCNHPLHAAGFYLNPKFFYSIEGDKHNDIVSGMFDCIEKLVPDINVQDKIIKEINSYKNAAGDLGRKMAVRARDTLLPAEWWSTYGGSCPNLARLATRILSQTSSLIGYRRNQSTFEEIHHSSNCLERQRLADLAFVHYNLQLRQMEGNDEEQRSTDPISVDSICILKDWIKGKDLSMEDHANSNWKALDHPRAENTRLLEPSHDEFENLGAGFDDYEIFNRLKDGEDEIVLSQHVYQ